MAIKKTQLYSSLWESANALRGGMDASSYKDYVLKILFVKYVSDKYKGDKYASFKVPEGGSFDDMIAAKGKTDIGEQINEIIIKIAKENDLSGIIDKTDFDDSDKLGEGKALIDTLTKLIGIFDDPALDFSSNRSGGDDILGDVYEYFMKHFASESGKSKGQFYTPSEVSRIMAQIIGAHDAKQSDQTAYDMACGSGSLLLKVASEASGNITLYGQEKDIDVAALAKMNMILHNRQGAEIEAGNTLADPKFKEGDRLKTFDFCVANPPFSDKGWTIGLDPDEDEFHRFDDGVPPGKNGDYAFFSHFIKSLKQKGKGAIVLPHGVLFRGNAEAIIREEIIKKGYIKGIIGLPTNLFFGTGIPAVILMVDKENAVNRKGIFMIDASKGFVKDGNKNKLRERDIHKIVDIFTNKKGDEKFSRMVSVSEIEKNDYNLNLPRYIDTSEEEDIQDIYAHLHGGVPNIDIDKMEEFWTEFSTLRNSLFDRKSEEYSEIKVQDDNITDIIFGNDEFEDFRRKVDSVFNDWQEKNVETLQGIDGDTNTKIFIKNLANDLLDTFRPINLLDEYAVYQYLMSYWDEIMQDDVYILIDSGWKAEVHRIIEINKNKKEVDKGWICDILPKLIVINEYFADEQKEIENLESQKEEVTRQMEEMQEEHSGEEDALFEVENKANANGRLDDYFNLAFNEYLKDEYKEYQILQKKLYERIEKQENLKLNKTIVALQNDKGRITIKAINERIKEENCADNERGILQKYIKINKKITRYKREMKECYNSLKEKIDIFIKKDNQKEYLKEINVLKDFVELIEQGASLKNEIKKQKKDLDDKLLKKYPMLTEDEVKDLVVNKKWMVYLNKSLSSEQERISHGLSQRIKELEERYHDTLPEIESEVAEHEEKVKNHLDKMGFGS